MGAKAILGGYLGLGFSNASATRYGPVGINGLTFQNSTEAQVQVTARRASTIRNLYVHVSSNTRTTNTTLVLRKNGADTTLTVTFGSGVTGEQSDVSHSISVADGDLLNWKLVTGSGGGTIQLDTLWCEIESGDTQAHVYFAPSPADTGTSIFSTTNASSSGHTPLVGRASGSIGSGDNAAERTDIPVSGVIDKLQVYVSANTRSTNTTMTVRLNGTNTSVTVTIPGGSTGLFEDNTHTATIAANDAANYRLTTGSGSGSISVSMISTRFVSDDEQAPFITSIEAAVSFISRTADLYLPGLGRTAGSSTEATVGIRLPFDANISGMFARVSKTASNTATFKSRINGADGTQTFSVTGSQTNVFFQDVTHAEDTAAGDIVNLVTRFSAAVDITYENLGFILGPPSVPGGTAFVPLMVAEPVTGGNPEERLPIISVEPVTGGNPNVRLPLTVLDPLTGGNPEVRLSIIAIEVIYLLREPILTASAVFPTMRGLSWSVHRKPNFNTKIADHVSGHEVRTAFMQYPRWEYNLTFEYLPNKSGALDLEQLMGFFLARQGQYDAFLFRDVNDYLAIGQSIGVGDGGTLRWQVSRTLGGFTEIIGQFDLSQQFSFVPADVNTGADTVAVAAHGYSTGYGPVQLVASAGALPAGLAAATNYWLIAASTGTLKFATSKANAEAGTAINITGAGTTGPFVASNSVAVYDNGVQVAPSAYDVTLPNIIEFHSAPTAAHVLTWDGKYYFVCRFIEDVQDYENFMYNLWTLQECNFKSVLTVE